MFLIARSVFHRCFNHLKARRPVNQELLCIWEVRKWCANNAYEALLEHPLYKVILTDSYRHPNTDYHQVKLNKITLAKIIIKCSFSSFLLVFIPSIVIFMSMCIVAPVNTGGTRRRQRDMYTRRDCSLPTITHLLVPQKKLLPTCRSTELCELKSLPTLPYLHHWTTSLHAAFKAAYYYYYH